MRVKKPCLLLHQVTLAVFVGVWMIAPGNVFHCRTLFGGWKACKYFDQPYKCIFKNTFSVNQVVSTH